MGLAVQNNKVAASHDPANPLRGTIGVPAEIRGHLMWMSLLVALLLAVWVVAAFGSPRVSFLLSGISEGVVVAVVVAVSMISLFTSLLLLAFPVRSETIRLSWIAAGFAVLGVWTGVAYMAESTGMALPGDSALLACWLTYLVAAALFAGGLLQSRPKLQIGTPNWGVIIGVPIVIAVLMLSAVFVSSGSLASDSVGGAVHSVFSWWHWGSHALLIAVAGTALYGAASYSSQESSFGFALTLGMGLYLGAVIHLVFLPMEAVSGVSSSTLLVLSASGVVMLGVMVELRRASFGIQTALVAERSYSGGLLGNAGSRAVYSRVLAHELNTPVCAIRRFADLLDVADLTFVQSVAVQGIRNEADTLRGLVKDVQAIVTADSALLSVSARPTTLNELLADCRVFAHSFAGACDIDVQSDFCGKVIADPERINQVLCNVVSNAVKYSPPGSRISVQATRRDSDLTIKITDEGFGIDFEDLERVFEPFTRGRDVRVQQTPGLGLGLYLSRMIIEAHGSQLVVQSRPGGGSTFSFGLEIADDPDPAR